MKNVLSKVGLDVHKEKVLSALITPHINTRAMYLKALFEFLCGIQWNLATPGL